MFEEVLGEPSAAALGRDRDRLLGSLRSVLASLDPAGTEAAAVDAGTRSAVAAGETGSITIEQAAGLLAHEDADRTAAAIAADGRERLLLSMSTAMLDVETLASRLDLDLDPAAVQAKLEGRLSMTVEEYLRLRTAVAAAADR